MKDLRNGVLVDLEPEDAATLAAQQAAAAGAVPQKVSKMQAELALWGAGLLDAVEASVAAAGPATKIYWRGVSEIHRDHPVVLAITGPMGITPQQLDDLFRTAAQIV